MSVPVAVIMIIVVALNSTSLPVACKIPLAIMVRRNPNGSCIRRPSPVTLMPFVMVSDRIPIAFHPDKIWFWLRGMNVHDRWRWRWRSDLDSNRNLRPNR